MMAAPAPSGPEQIVFQGKIIEVVERPTKFGEKVVTIEFARRAPGVRIIIPTGDGNILLTREYRPELNSYDHRLPGGKIIDTLADYNAFLKAGGDIQAEACKAAEREAREEAGIILKDAELFAISRCGLTVEWDLYYFVVTSYEVSSQALEDAEDITLAPTSVAEAKDMCLDGRIAEERSALILLRFLAR